MIKIIFYKLAVGALFILCISTVIMIWSIFDVSFSERAMEYITLWLMVVWVCIVLMVPHLVERYQG
jgi:hypothetical protein